jgi:hypothetical protein
LNIDVMYSVTIALVSILFAKYRVSNVKCAVKNVKDKIKNVPVSIKNVKYIVFYAPGRGKNVLIRENFVLYR